MGVIMNSPKGSEIICHEKSEPTCGTRHDSLTETGSQSYVTVGEQTFNIINYVTQKCQMCHIFKE